MRSGSSTARCAAAIALSSLLCMSQVAAYDCAHDQIIEQQEIEEMNAEVTIAETGEKITVGELHARSRRLNLRESTESVQAKQQRAKRFLSSTSWEDIRVTYEFAGDAGDWPGHDGSTTTSSHGLDPTESNLIRTAIVADSIAKLTSTLQIRRDPLDSTPNFAQQRCSSSYTGVTPHACASRAQVSCGLKPMPVNYYGKDEVCSGPSTCALGVEPGTGTGVPASDFHIFVFAQHTAACAGGTLAYAATCSGQEDEYNRPKFGYMNLCPQKMDTADSGYVASWTSTFIHEVLHAMGFSASGFWKFHDKNTMLPLTPRDAGYPQSKPAAEHIHSHSCSGATIDSYLPSENIVEYFSERGATKCTTSAEKTDNENCIAKITLPSSSAVAKWYFDCPSVQGVELENKPTGGACRPLGSHLEQRIFETNMMASTTAQRVAKMDPITLAVLDDSGWYNVKFEDADGMADRHDYGFKRGCDMAHAKTCIEAGAATNDRVCDTSAEVGCDPYLDGYGQCMTTMHSPPPISRMQYYSGSPTEGGSLAQRDYCPHVQAYSNRQCFDSADDDANSPVFGRFHGTNGACHVATIYDSRHVVATPPTHGCFETSCSESGGVYSYTISLSDDSDGTSRGTPLECTTKGQILTHPAMTGTIVCVDPNVMCRANQKYSRPTPSGSSLPAPSASGTAATSATASTTSTAAPTSTASNTPSASVTPSRTPPSLPSASTTSSAAPTSTASNTPSASVTPSRTPPSLPSASTTSTAAPTSTASNTPSASVTPSRSPSSPATPSTTPTPMPTPSGTPSPSPSSAAVVAVPVVVKLTVESTVNCAALMSQQELFINTLKSVIATVLGIDESRVKIVRMNACGLNIGAASSSSARRRRMKRLTAAERLKFLQQEREETRKLHVSFHEIHQARRLALGVASVDFTVASTSTASSSLTAAVSSSSSSGVFYSSLASSAGSLFPSGGSLSTSIAVTASTDSGGSDSGIGAHGSLIKLKSTTKPNVNCQGQLNPRTGTVTTVCQ